ncbi:MAG: hypothetical protein JWN01_52 [Patescibacteria group bacterium]|nr:hypothetical protein [Patescibacteria group bacterium]
MTGKSSQKAGNNAQQIQVETFVVGINEKRVREIVDEKLVLALNDFTAEAASIARGRSEKFGSKLIGKMVKESALSAFADPSFQILLVEAQKRAASTEREHDYDLLAELMLHRFKKGAHRSVRAGISRAVEIVDQVSDEALLGLTVLHAVSNFVPITGKIDIGLKTLDGLFGKLLDGNLPTGAEWLDHLDILDSVRISSLGGTKLLEDYWYEMFDGCVKNGMPKDSEALSEAKKLLKDSKLDQTILIASSASEDYFKLDVRDKSAISRLQAMTNPKDGKTSHTRPLTNKEMEALTKIYDLYDGSSIPKEEFVHKIDEHQNLQQLREWWNLLKDQSIQITSVGRVLASSNAQRLDNTLPPLD